MSIKKFYITKDTTVTNAYKENLRERGTSANMGLADSLEVFFIYGQNPLPEVESDSLEESRIIIFPNLQQIVDYYGGLSAPDGVKFILRLFNAEHPFTLPRNFTLDIYLNEDNWTEGNGLDMESYKDEDAANWTNRTVSSSWAFEGIVDTSSEDDYLYSVDFDSGEEDLELDVTELISERWNDGGMVSFVIAFSTDQTSGENNFYTKKFFARSSEFFFKRPVIEARDSRTSNDDRGKFYKASPFVTDNEQNIYLYNSIGGVRTNLNIVGDLTVELFEDEAMTTPPITTAVATNEKAGVYKAAVTVPSSVEVTTIYEKWTADENTIKTGSIALLTRQPETDASDTEYLVDITNLKTSYTRQETAKFRIYTRQKDWNPTIYTVASKEIENLIVEKMYYKIVRLVDEKTVLDYGIGTDGINNEHTLVSYDALGSYFDFDMSLLEEGYMYGIKLLFSINGELREQQEIFKFRVD